MLIKEMTVDMAAWAKAAALMAHESVGQTRKYGNAHYGRERYYFHPCRVAELVATVTSLPTLISAAALHDVLEDVSPKSPVFTPHWLLASFGHGVLFLVVECSNFYSKDEEQRRVLLEAIDLLIPVFPGEAQRMLLDAHAAFMFADGANRDSRKQAEAERYAMISEDAKIIKRADLFDNSLSMDGAPTSFAAQWHDEREYAESLIGSWLAYETEVRAARTALACT
jgi:hypothetical protein